MNWVGFLFLLKVFCVFRAFFLPFSRSRIREAALGGFDSILGANSGGSSEERNLER